MDWYDAQAAQLQLLRRKHFQRMLGRVKGLKKEVKIASTHPTCQHRSLSSA